MWEKATIEMPKEPKVRALRELPKAMTQCSEPQQCPPPALHPRIRLLIANRLSRLSSAKRDFPPILNAHHASEHLDRPSKPSPSRPSHRPAPPLGLVRRRWLSVSWLGRGRHGTGSNGFRRICSFLFSRARLPFVALHR